MVVPEAMEECLILFFRIVCSSCPGLGLRVGRDGGGRAREGMGATGAHQN